MKPWLRWTLIIVAAVVLGAPLFVFKLYKIPAGSMVPTLLIGDHVYVNRLARSPRRGDIIVFDYPKEPDKAFIKRLIAVGGDTIEVRDDVVFINGQPVPRKPVDGACEYDEYIAEMGRWEKRKCQAFEEELDGHRYRVVFEAGGQHHSSRPVTVPEGQYFVLGDNRDNSHDSRFWGFVPAKMLNGTALFTLVSYGPDGVRHGRFGKNVRN